jgi:hypothetical protein
MQGSQCCAFCICPCLALPRQGCIPSSLHLLLLSYCFALIPSQPHCMLLTYGPSRLVWGLGTPPPWTSSCTTSTTCAAEHRTKLSACSRVKVKPAPLPPVNSASATRSLQPRVGRRRDRNGRMGAQMRTRASEKERERRKESHERHQKCVAQLTISLCLCSWVVFRSSLLLLQTSPHRSGGVD